MSGVFFGGRCEREGGVEECSDRWMTLPLPNNSSVASIHGVPRERVRTKGGRGGGIFCLIL